MTEEPPQLSREIALAAWDAAAAAFESGDLDAFAEHARAAAIAAARMSDARAARGLVAMRARLLDRSVAEPPIVDALAATLTELSRCTPREADFLWPYALTLAGDLPAHHPLRAAAIAHRWDALSVVMVVAALAAGDAADRSLFAEVVPPEVVAARLAALVAQGALVELGDGFVGVAPILSDVCFLRPSPHLLAPARSRLPPETFAAASFDRDGVFVAEGATAAIALATLRAAQLPAVVVPRDEVTDAARLAWFARDAAWRGLSLLVELDAPPASDMLAVLAAVPRIIVLPAAPLTSDAIGAALAPHRRDLVAWRPLELSPARAAEVVAAELGVPLGHVRIGHLHATELDALVDTLVARRVTGDDALWALRAELAERAAAELAPFVYDAAPEIPAGVIDRARELLAADAGWSGRATALVAPLTVAASVALALASDRGVIAATLALGAADAGERIDRAMSAARRWGAVLCVGIDRATPAAMSTFARRLAAGGVVAVIATRPGTPVPLALAPLVSTLTI